MDKVWLHCCPHASSLRLVLEGLPLFFRTPRSGFSRPRRAAACIVGDNLDLAAVGPCPYSWTTQACAGAMWPGERLLPHFGVSATRNRLPVVAYRLRASHHRSMTRQQGTVQHVQHVGRALRCAACAVFATIIFVKSSDLVAWCCISHAMSSTILWSWRVFAVPEPLASGAMSFELRKTVCRAASSQETASPVKILKMALLFDVWLCHHARAVASSAASDSASVCLCHRFRYTSGPIYSTASSSALRGPCPCNFYRGVGNPPTPPSPVRTESREGARAS